MREAPDVIMLGEMRDYETVQTALTAAETGPSAAFLAAYGGARPKPSTASSIPSRPISSSRWRVQLSMVLRAVVSQRLVPTVDGTQVPCSR